MNRNPTKFLLWLWLATALLFAVAPGLDLWVAGLFYDHAGNGFYLDGIPALQMLREIIWASANILVLGVILYTLLNLYSRKPTQIPGRFWAFCLTLIALGPGLLVNVILKDQWGRARPADVMEFGGLAEFTPPWQLADQCVSNCSFVSGEAAGAITAAIIAGLFLWNMIPHRQRHWLLLACLSFALIGSGMRIMMGRHFLSDVVWSFVLISSLAIWLGSIFRISKLLPRMTYTALRSDAATVQKIAEGLVTASMPVTRRVSRIVRRLQ
ncbi:phosphatase PAP2 family protein [Paracoccus aerodenitrificans]|uniref:phosphatase PAP2 family protein n=1 Tax=Paracoccus aerodenitrificans TaxID=3017781 RepID=UPI0022F00B89|nr:phosphatase PAP2 family protein [Paracoccus aerodenitrificans]WBU63451.1 phosphatase PAP2 family protein [Paracoccus aerodenitrificans]